MSMVEGDSERTQRIRLEAAAETLGLALDDEVLDRLMAYLHLLRRWNGVYNLTALREADQMMSHHVLDCLATVPAVRRWADARVAPTAMPPPAADDAHQDQAVHGLRILDVGSGGGLPGVVLAATEPAWQVSCVDTVAKKASFIRQVAAELHLPNLRGLHARVENLVSPEAPAGSRSRGGFDLITSRAFASLFDFTRLTRHLLAPQGVWMAMKGRAPHDEQAALPGDVEVFHVEQLRVPGLDAHRCLVWMRARAA